MFDYVVCVRNKKIEDGEKVFGNEPGPTLFLKVPGNRYPKPFQAISRRDWVSEVLAQAETGVNEITGKPTGDILVFIH